MKPNPRINNNRESTPLKLQLTTLNASKITKKTCVDISFCAFVSEPQKTDIEPVPVLDSPIYKNYSSWLLTILL